MNIPVVPADRLQVLDRYGHHNLDFSLFDSSTTGEVATNDLPGITERLWRGIRDKPVQEDLRIEDITIDSFNASTNGRMSLEVQGNVSLRFGSLGERNVRYKACIEPYTFLAVGLDENERYFLPEISVRFGPDERRSVNPNPFTGDNKHTITTVNSMNLTSDLKNEGYREVRIGEYQMKVFDQLSHMVSYFIEQLGLLRLVQFEDYWGTCFDAGMQFSVKKLAEKFTALEELAKIGYVPIEYSYLLNANGFRDLTEDKNYLVTNTEAVFLQEKRDRILSETAQDGTWIPLGVGEGKLEDLLIPDNVDVRGYDLSADMVLTAANRMKAKRFSGNVDDFEALPAYLNSLNGKPRNILMAGNTLMNLERDRDNSKYSQFLSGLRGSMGKDDTFIPIFHVRPEEPEKIDEYIAYLEQQYSTEANADLFFPVMKKLGFNEEQVTYKASYNRKANRIESCFYVKEDVNGFRAGHRIMMAASYRPTLSEAVTSLTDYGFDVKPLVNGTKDTVALICKPI